jgi:TPR repeat protein
MCVSDVTGYSANQSPRITEEINDHKDEIEVVLLLLQALYYEAKDPVQAVPLYRRAVELGSSAAMLNLGLMYQQGRGGLAKDEVKAARLRGQAAVVDYLRARLGSRYKHSCAGLSKDEVEAALTLCSFSSSKAS